jgi:hypothetical protein
MSSKSIGRLGLLEGKAKAVEGKSSAVERKANATEGKSNAGDALLRFADGSTMTVRVSEPVRLTIAAMARAHAREMGRPLPDSCHDPLLDLLERAESVECPMGPMLAVAYSALHRGRG